MAYIDAKAVMTKSENGRKKVSMIIGDEPDYETSPLFPEEERDLYLDDDYQLRKYNFTMRLFFKSVGIHYSKYEYFNSNHFYLNNFSISGINESENTRILPKTLNSSI